MFPQSLIATFDARYIPGHRTPTWQAICPAHNDTRPSLSLYIGRTGCLIVHCRAGCSTPSVLAARGLKMADLFPREDVKDRPFIPRREIAVYPYTDEEGRILYEKVRYEPKDFRQRSPDGSGGWRWSIEGVRRVPFQLCELLANPGRHVLLLEGEKDVLTAESLDLLATCTTEGAGCGWDDDTYPTFLRGRRVTIIPDEDRAGIAHAMRVSGCLMMHGVGSVRVVRLPGLSEHGDLSDWVAAGGTREQLVLIATKSPEWKST